MILTVWSESLAVVPVPVHRPLPRSAPCRSFPGAGSRRWLLFYHLVHIILYSIELVLYSQYYICWRRCGPCARSETSNAAAAPARIPRSSAVKEPLFISTMIFLSGADHCVTWQHLVEGVTIQHEEALVAWYNRWRDRWLF